MRFSRRFERTWGPSDWWDIYWATRPRTLRACFVRLRGLCTKSRIGLPDVGGFKKLYPTMLAHQGIFGARPVEGLTLFTLPRIRKTHLSCLTLEFEEATPQKTARQLPPIPTGSRFQVLLGQPCPLPNRLLDLPPEEKQHFADELYRILLRENRIVAEEQGIGIDSKLSPKKIHTVIEVVGKDGWLENRSLCYLSLEEND